MKRISELMIRDIVPISLFLFAVLYISIEKKRLQALIKSSENNSLLYLLSTQWLYRKINGENVFKCLVNSNYKKIGIYGKNHSCECLCSELENMGIEVAYIIDNSANGRYGNVPIITMDMMTKDVDAIIVTNLGKAEIIGNKLKEIYTGPILSLEDIVRWE